MRPVDIGLPKKFTAWRPGQEEALNGFIQSQAFAYLLESPTGSGKSLIGAAVQKMAHQPIVYLTSTKQLQAQVLGDFPDETYLLMGRQNYPCVLHPDDFPLVTAADCPGKCRRFDECAYQHAKHAAVNSPMAVLNYAYFLAESGLAGSFSGRILICDECVPEGTAISTPGGDMTIEHIKPGDTVWGYESGKVVPAKVTRVVHRNTLEPLVPLQELKATPKHPIWTPQGYVPIAHLSGFDSIGIISYTYGHDKPYLRTVPAGIHGQRKGAEHEGGEASFLQPPVPLRQPEESESWFSKDVPSSLRQSLLLATGQTGILFSELFVTSQCSHRGRNGADPQIAGGAEKASRGTTSAGISPFRPEPYLQAGGQGEGTSHTEDQRICPPYRGERFNNVTATLIGNCLDLGHGSASENRSQATRCSHGLQSRCGQSYSQSGYRDRWPVSQGPGSAREGQEERGDTLWPGVEGFAFHEQRDTHFDADGIEPDTPCHQVYNLETSTHNYFAEQVLVHNCDTLQNQLENFINVDFTAEQIEDFGLPWPNDRDDFISWLEWGQVALPQVDHLFQTLTREFELEGEVAELNVPLIRQLKKIEKLKTKVESFVHDVTRNWVFYPGKTKWEFKPVWVRKYAKRAFWNHARRALCMSAFIPPDMPYNVGLDEWPVERSQMPCLFPVQNRLIIYKPVANVVYGQQDELVKLAGGLQEIIEKHPDQKILVHSTSYPLRTYLMSHLESDRLITHESGNREMQIEIFKASPRPLVMISPSMDRGVSLDGDLCRVVVIAKVPYASLADPQVKRRMASANGDGQRWYAMNTIATIIQACGRGVRSDTDWCTTYILDRQFQRLYGANRQSFPAWFREAIRKG